MQRGVLALHHHTHESESGAATVLIASEWLVIAMFVVVLAGLLVVVAEVRVVLHPMHHRGGHMRPLMQVQYAKGVKGQGEGEEVAQRIRVTKVSGSTFTRPSGTGLKELWLVWPPSTSGCGQPRP